jgi:hypothetical protein
VRAWRWPCSDVCHSKRQNNKVWGGDTDTLGPSGCTIRGGCLHLGLHSCYGVPRARQSCECDQLVPPLKHLADPVQVVATVSAPPVALTKSAPQDPPVMGPVSALKALESPQRAKTAPSAPLAPSGPAPVTLTTVLTVPKVTAMLLRAPMSRRKRAQCRRRWSITPRFPSLGCSPV